MKFSLKLAAASILALCGFAPLSKATITINFTAGDLRNSNGVLMPQGGLLQLVADTQRNGFGSPTATSFVSGDDFVVASFTLGANYQGVGTTQNALSIMPGDFSGLDAGDPLIFRWFPSLNGASTAPGTGTMYGQFNSTTNQDGSNLTVPWTEPADGGTFTLNFITATLGGSNPESAGYATSSVPEPSTFVFAGAALMGAVGLHLRRRRS